MMSPEKLIELYPHIYHMAERGSWPSIREHGLLSSNEVTKCSGAQGEVKDRLRREHRAEKTSVQVPGVGTIVLRDQIPMPPNRIERTLPVGFSASDWYELINERVFFWAEKERLHRLLNARQYRHLEHDVLTIDTASLLSRHATKIQLCHMNSGNTYPAMVPRGPHIFKGIENYEVNSKGLPKKRVVEITVLRGVVDIAEHVLEVRRMLGSAEIEKIY